MSEDEKMDETEEEFDDDEVVEEDSPAEAD